MDLPTTKEYLDNRLRALTEIRDGWEFETQYNQVIGALEFVAAVGLLTLDEVTEFVNRLARIGTHMQSMLPKK